MGSCSFYAPLPKTANKNKPNAKPKNVTGLQMLVTLTTKVKALVLNLLGGHILVQP